MKITQINVTPLDGERIKAMASITFDNCFVVSSIKIIAGKDDDFISFPSYKGKDEKYHDIAFPITADFRNEIADAIFVEYDKKLTEKEQQTAPKPATRRRR